MASQASTSIYIKLALFLISTAFLSVTALYFELRKENAKLEQKIKVLEASQVLLMVPDDQADALRDWLNSHPESIDALIKQGQKKSKSKVKTESQLK